jgi:hypothetical protein
MIQVPRCGVVHPTLDFPTYVDDFRHADDIDRIRPVICTEPLDRHGAYHRGLGPHLRIVKWH